MIPISDDNPTRRTPIVTWSILILCVGVFLWELSFDETQFEAMIRSLGFTPRDFFGRGDGGEWLTILTSMFLHGGLMHLGGNMLYLWIFGNNVEDAMGHARYLIFYLVCGAAAALGQAIAEPGTTIPMVGASGAISGVLGAYLVLYPRVRVYALVPIGFLLTSIALPAWAMLIYWVGLQVLSGLLSADAGTGVAFWAHVGGFLAGVILVKQFARRDRVTEHTAQQWQPRRMGWGAR
jgi:membrane associated rhomboid family serine protease